MCAWSRSQRWEILYCIAWLLLLENYFKIFLSLSHALTLRSVVWLVFFRNSGKNGMAATGATDVCRKLNFHIASHTCRARMNEWNECSACTLWYCSIGTCRLWFTATMCALIYFGKNSEMRWKKRREAYTHQPRLQTVYVDTGSTQSDVIRSKKPTRHLRELRCVTPHTHT